MSVRGKTIITQLLEVMAAKPGKVLTAEQIAKSSGTNVGHARDSLTGYARRHPHGPVERISSGIFRWNENAFPVSAPPEPTSTAVGEATVNADYDSLKETNSYPPGQMAKTIAASHALTDASSNLDLRSAVIAHVGELTRSDDGGYETPEIYFVWHGKMWKAYQI